MLFRSSVVERATRSQSKGQLCVLRHVTLMVRPLVRSRQWALFDSFLLEDSGIARNAQRKSNEKESESGGEGVGDARLSARDDAPVAPRSDRSVASTIRVPQVQSSYLLSPIDWVATTVN